MTTFPKWVRGVGFVLHLLIGGLILFAGAGKVFGFAPPEVAEGLSKAGLGGQIQLLGWGEMITAVLLVLPWTRSLGVLMTSGFWGGVICFNMEHGQPYAMWAAALVLTWVAAFLRDPQTFASFAPRTATTAR